MHKSMEIFQVVYDTPYGVHKYCLLKMNLRTAEYFLTYFKRKYLNPDGTGKSYPNFKGEYRFRNPRIVMDSPNYSVPAKIYRVRIRPDRVTIRWIIRNDCKIVVFYVKKG